MGKRTVRLFSEAMRHRFPVGRHTFTFTAHLHLNPSAWGWLLGAGECDILFTNMGKSAMIKLSRACAILPASCLAVAVAFAPLAARADEVMFRGIWEVSHA